MTERLAHGGMPAHLPGSDGEHELQQRYQTVDRARSFYRRQMLDHLNGRMREFLARQELVFVATADARGACDCSLRAGPPGFVQVLDDRNLAYPEYRGNGVMASLGNIHDNPHIGLMFPDFVRDVIGLHVNGRASVVEPDNLLATHPGLTPSVLNGATAGRRIERWVRVSVHEAYIHCAKHIPRMVKVDRHIDWGTDDVKRKGGDFFGASQESCPADARQT